MAMTSRLYAGLSGRSVRKSDSVRIAASCSASCCWSSPPPSSGCEAEADASDSTLRARETAPQNGSSRAV